MRRGVRKAALYGFTSIAALLLFTGLAIYPTFWAPFAISAAAAFILWRVDRRATHRELIGRCKSCGYDRRGLAVGVKCPECGILPAS